MCGVQVPTAVSSTHRPPAHLVSVQDIVRRVQRDPRRALLVPKCDGLVVHVSERGRESDGADDGPVHDGEHARRDGCRPDGEAAPVVGEADKRRLAVLARDDKIKPTRRVNLRDRAEQLAPARVRARVRGRLRRDATSVAEREHDVPLARAQRQVARRRRLEHEQRGLVQDAGPQRHATAIATERQPHNHTRAVLSRDADVGHGVRGRRRRPGRRHNRVVARGRAGRADGKFGRILRAPHVFEVRAEAGRGTQTTRGDVGRVE